MPSQIAQLKIGNHVLNDDGSILYHNEKYTIDPRKSFSYAYCADTKYSECILDTIAEVDMLYHEATFLEDMAERAELTYHSTAKQAAEIAKRAKVGKLILGHFSTRYRDLDPVLNEAREVFKESYLGQEGEEFVLIE